MNTLACDMPRAEDRRVCHYSLLRDKRVCVWGCGWRVEGLHWLGLILLEHVLCWCVCEEVCVCLFVGRVLWLGLGLCVCVLRVGEGEGGTEEAIWQRGLPTVHSSVYTHIHSCVPHNLAIGLTHTHRAEKAWPGSYPQPPQHLSSLQQSSLRAFCKLFETSLKSLHTSPHSGANNRPLHLNRHFAFLFSGSSIACHMVSAGCYGLLK